VTNWSAAVQLLLGLPESRVLGHPFSDLFTKKDARKGLPAHLLKCAREKRTHAATVLFPSPQGTPRPVNVRLQPLRGNDGQLRGFAITLEEVGKRPAVKRAA
jgi:PAS domain S-box-containing protein